MLSSNQRVVLSAWLSRLLTVGAQLLAVRSLLGVLGVESFAAWTLLTSLTGWFLLVDFGLAQATQNKVSQLIARGQPEGEAVRSAVRGVMLAGLILLVLLLACSNWLGPWLLQRMVEAKAAMLSFALAVSLLVPSAWSAVATKIWYAQGKGLRANLVPAIAAILALVSATTAPSYVSAPSVRLLVALTCWLLPTALAGALSLLWIYHHAPKDAENWQWMPEWRPALAFWTYAALGIVTLNVDYIILSNTVQAASLVGYSLLAKIFGFMFFFYSATLAMYSPRVTAANANGTLPLIFCAVSQHMRISALALLLFSVVLWWMLPAIFQNIFDADQFRPGLQLYMAFTALYLVRVWADGYAMLLSAMDELQILGRWLPIQAVLSVGLQWWWASHHGSQGIVAGLLVSYLLTVSWAFPSATRHLIGRFASG